MLTRPRTTAACLWDVLATPDDPRDPLATMHLVAALPTRPVALELAGEHERVRLLARAWEAATGQALVAALYSAFPQARLAPVAPADDPARPAGPGEHACAVEFTLREPEQFPLRTYDRDAAELQGDPLAVLVRAFDGLAPGERLLLRLTLQPAPRGWAARYRRAARQRLATMRERTGEHDGRDGGGLAINLLLMGLVLAGTLALVAWRRGGLPLAAWWMAMPTHHPLAIGLAAGLLLAGPVVLVVLLWHRLFGTPELPTGDLLTRKLEAPGCLTRLQVTAWGPDRVRVRDRLDQVAALLALYERSDGNALVPRRARPASGPAPLRRWPLWRARVLNAYELAGLWGSIGALADAGALVRTGARRRRPSRRSPDGVRWLADGCPLGTSDQGGVSMPIAFPDDLFGQPTLILGKTRMGKSTALGHLLAHAMRDPARAVVLIDPHGDLAQTVLGLVPPSRQAELVAIDLADPDHAVGFNLFDVTTGRAPATIVADMLSSLRRLWPDTWGPRMELILRHAALALTHANLVLPPSQQFTILHVEPLLQNAPFRLTVLDRLCADLPTRDWWRSYYDQLPPRERDEYINPVLTKMALFSTLPTARRILGQPCGRLDLTAAVLAGRIVIVRLAKGVVRADLAGLVGALLGEYIDLAIEGQAGIAPDQRRPVLVAIDELQVLAGIDYARLLRELRKYGGGFLLCTQEFGSLEAAQPGVRSLFFGNVDGLLVFRVAEAEGRLLAGALDERFSPIDLANLPQGVCAAKLSERGQPAPAFSLRVHPPLVGDAALAADLWRASGRRWGRPVAEAEALVAAGQARVAELERLAIKQAAPAQTQARGQTASRAATHPATPVTGSAPEARQLALLPAAGAGPATPTPIPATAIAAKGGTRRSKRPPRAGRQSADSPTS